jgi:hypothetical protein
MVISIAAKMRRQADSRCPVEEQGFQDTPRDEVVERVIVLSFCKRARARLAVARVLVHTAAVEKSLVEKAKLSNKYSVIFLVRARTQACTEKELLSIQRCHDAFASKYKHNCKP